MENNKELKGISRRKFLKASVILGGVASLSAIGGKAFASSAFAEGWSYHVERWREGKGYGAGCNGQSA